MATNKDTTSRATHTLLDGSREPNVPLSPHGFANSNADIIRNVFEGLYNFLLQFSEHG